MFHFFATREIAAGLTRICISVFGVVLRVGPVVCGTLEESWGSRVGPHCVVRADRQLHSPSLFPPSQDYSSGKLPSPSRGPRDSLARAMRAAYRFPIAPLALVCIRAPLFLLSSDGTPPSPIPTQPQSLAVARSSDDSETKCYHSSCLACGGA